MGALDAPPSPDPSLCPMRTPGSSFPPGLFSPGSQAHGALPLVSPASTGARTASSRGAGGWPLCTLFGADGALAGCSREGMAPGSGVCCSALLLQLFLGCQEGGWIVNLGTPPSEASETHRGRGCWGPRTRGGTGVGWPRPSWAQSGGQLVSEALGCSPLQAPGPGLATAVTSLGAPG